MLQKIDEEHCWIARFGDGDLGLLFGKPEGYQQCGDKLTARLKEVLRYNGSDRLLIGLSKSIFVSQKYFYPRYRIKYLPKISRLLDRKKQYYYTDISRFYHSSDDGKRELEYVRQLKQIWEQRDITIVEGEQTRMGVGNDLFDNAKRIRRILCPAENAFFHYDEIYAAILEKVPRDELVILDLGPTATILAYDLFHEGYQAVDLGHVDISYEWFLRGVKDATERIVIPGKYTNEAKGGNIVDNCLDPLYQNQIIAHIGVEKTQFSAA
jgi:glycosyltransferase family protein